jgi:hypothetical protein
MLKNLNLLLMRRHLIYYNKPHPEDNDVFQHITKCFSDNYIMWLYDHFSQKLFNIIVTYFDSYDTNKYIKYTIDYLLKKYIIVQNGHVYKYNSETYNRWVRNEDQGYISNYKSNSLCCGHKYIVKQDRLSVCDTCASIENSENRFFHCCCYIFIFPDNKRKILTYSNCKI